ncbi:RNA-directed DNA polymerase, eukaryota, reverse transcriptase zinc-binding domain protein [Tanacetum coccineum]
MWAKQRRSKRKPKLPNKYADSICDLNNKKHQQLNSEITERSDGDNGGNDTIEEIRVSNGDNDECEGPSGEERKEEDEMTSMQEDKPLEEGESESSDSERDVWNNSNDNIKHKVHNNNTNTIRKLDFEPAVIEDGNEFVIFDEELVNDGSDMFCNDNEVYCFKFKSEEGMNYVLENSPWMVNGRPLIVQKWSPDVCLDKPEPNKFPYVSKCLAYHLE